MRTTAGMHKSLTAVFLLFFMIPIVPCLAKKSDDAAPESVRFWVSPDGDVFVEETRRAGGLFSKVKKESSGVLLRLRWPATVLFQGLPDEPMLDNPFGSVHFIGGERLLGVTTQLSGDDDFRVLFWDGIQGIWRLLAPMATLDPVRGVFRTTLGPKRWVAVSSPDDGVRVCGFLLDNYLSDVEKKLCIDCSKPMTPRSAVQSAEGKFVGVVMTPQKPTISQRSRMTDAEIQALIGKVEVGIFDVTGTESTVQVSTLEKLDLGGADPSAIVAAGDAFACGFYGEKTAKMQGFKLSTGKVEKVKAAPEIARLGSDSMIDLSPSIHGDGFILIDSDGSKVTVRKYSLELEKAGEWKLTVPTEAEPPIKQLIFNEKMGFLYLSDSKGKVIVRTVGGSSDVLWPKKEEKSAH